MNLSFRISADVPKGLKKESWKLAEKRAENALAYTVLRTTRPFVPMLTGTLSNTAHVENNNEVVYDQPYAQYLYYGKVMIDPKHNASGFMRPDGSWSGWKGSKKVVTGKDLVFTKDFNNLAQSHWIEASEAANKDIWKHTVQAVIYKYAT